MSLRLRLPILLSCSFLFLTTFLPAQAQPSSAELRTRFEDRQKEIDALWSVKQWDKAVPMLEEMLATPAMMRVPDMRAYIHYNLACGYSLQGKKDQSLALLRQLAADGGADPNQLENDSDFESLRADPAFKEILATAHKAWDVRNRFWNSPALLVPFKEALSEDEKIAGLVRFWSEAKYNFAWFEHVSGLEWDAKMLEYLPRVRAAKTTADYYRVLMEFAALLKDGHTNVYPPAELRDAFWSSPPVYVTLVEGRVVVSRVLTDDALAAAGVRRGNELIAIDGLPVREYGERFVMPLQSASSPQDRERRTFAYYLLDGPRDSKVRLQSRDESGKDIEVTTTRLAQAELDKRDTTPPRPRFDFRLLDDGRVAYVALNSFGESAVVADFEKAWPEIRKAPALIVDVRRNGGGNSSYGSQILGYLVAQGGDVEAVRTRLYRPAYRAWGNPEEWPQPDLVRPRQAR